MSVDNIFDTIINPDVEEEQVVSEKKETKSKQINYREEYEEARLRLKDFYNFDEHLKLDIPTRLMSIYGVGIDKLNSFSYMNHMWYEIRWKHIEFIVRETTIYKKKGYKCPERALIVDETYRIFDAADNFLKFEHHN